MWVIHDGDDYFRKLKEATHKETDSYFDVNIPYMWDHR